MSWGEPDAVRPGDPGDPGEAEISIRKEHHLDICTDDERYPDPAAGGTSLDQVRLVHRALPELDYTAIDTGQRFLRARLRLPLLISCMTGGSGRGRSANRSLAEAAQRAGVAVGVGSIRPLLRDPDTFADFHVKPHAPDVPVLANLGAVQLRELGAAALRPVLQRLEVQALAIHLNAGQELFQPGGDRDFRGLLETIAGAVAGCGVPVLVKETGFGIGPREVRLLLGYGVRYVDVAGSGGTNWIAVEGERLAAPQRRSARAFDDWGLPTGVLLAALGGADAGRVIASGGLRHGVHLAKALALGAALGAMALPFIRAVMAGGVDGVLDLIARIEHELRTAMTLCGAATLAALRHAPVMQSAAFRHQVAELRRVTAAAHPAACGSGSEEALADGATPRRPAVPGAQGVPEPAAQPAPGDKSTTDSSSGSAPSVERIAAGG